MGFRIKVLNKVSQQGLKLFEDEFLVSKEETDPEAVVVRSAPVDTDKFTSLLAVARAGAGVNNITVPKATEKGICVFNTPGANANAVKELVFIMLGNVARNILDGLAFCEQLKGLSDGEITKRVEKGKSNYRGFELQSRTLGVLGLGKIGTLVANGGVERGMRVIGFDPNPSLENTHLLSSKAMLADRLSEVVSQADILTLHVPLNDSTRGMVNRQFLEPLNENAILVNFARGGIVNEKDVCSQLDSGKLYAYLTDFTSKRFLNHPKAICTPHLGASTAESEENCAVMAVNALRSYLKLGHITHSVNFPTIESPPDRSFTTRLIVINRDVPKMIGSVSQTLGEHGINIESYRNESNGKIGYNIVDLRRKIPADVIKQIEANPNVLRTRVIDL